MTDIVEYVNDVCGIHFRSVLIEKAGEKISQHVHDHDHPTYCGSGSARLRVNGEVVGDVHAGGVVAVLAGQHHEFEALEDNTRLACIHDVASAESIKR